jgi:hypothetical protein
MLTLSVLALLVARLVAVTGSMDCKQGALAAGSDVWRANMTVEAATDWCERNSTCAGFTARGAAKETCSTAASTLDCHFKFSLDSNDDAAWTMWRKPNWSAPLYHCNSGGCALCNPPGAPCSRVTYLAPDCFGACMPGAEHRVS